MKFLDPDALAFGSMVRPGDHVMWGQAAAEPLELTTRLMAQRRDIGEFDAFIGATWSATADPAYADCVRFHAYCGAGTNRNLAKARALDILPCHYSQLPAMIRSGQLKVDVLLLQLATANRDGQYSLSMAHEYLLPAIDRARIVIAEINDQAPWTFGERTIVETDIDFAIHTSRPLPAPPRGAPGEVECAVARRIATLIEDGDTLQFGIGALPEAVLGELADRRDLGVHSGALVDGVAMLAAAGVITNARKSIDRGITIGGVAMGGKPLCDYLHLNAAVQFRSVDYTHSADVLAAIDRFVAINSAIEVDLTGQINAEIVGGVYVGAVGGALDFLRGAQRSKGGLPIVALPSTAGRGEKITSRIVNRLSGPVSTPRCDAGIIVTEHGIADLRGLSISRRIPLMLSLASPEFHESLASAVI